MPKNTKRSGSKVQKLAQQTLISDSSSQVSKSLAASVIAQANTSKQTGKEMETKASKILKSDKYSDDTKTLAASVLSQSNKKR